MTINSLYLYIPKLKPSVETQTRFIEASQKNHNISFDENHTKRRVMSDLLVEHNSGSAQQVNGPKYLIGAHQTRIRSDSPNKNINIAIFDNLVIRKTFVEIDGQRYPRDSLLVNYEKNEHKEQKKDFETFFKDYIGEPKLNTFLSNPDMKTKSPLRIIVSRHKIDHILPKKIQILLEYSRDPDKARLFLVFIRQREIEIVSDGKKLIELKVI